MAKDWDKLDYFKKQKKIREMGIALGISHSRYGEEGETTSRPGMPGSKGYTTEDYEKAVVNAMQNDYDTRRSIEAGKASGNKRFADIGDGISNISEAYSANLALKKTHKDMGNTGKFSSANDYGNVTNHLVKEQTEKFGSKFASSQAVEDLKNELMSGQQSAQAGSGTEIQPVEHSPEIQEAKYRQDPSQINIFNSTDVDGEGGSGELTSAGSDDSQRQSAASNFLDKYKADLTKGLNLTPKLR